MAEIAVIIPAYNAESTVQRAIQSVVDQTFSDWEIFLIDDGSTDQTLERVAAIHEERVSVFSFDNAGQAEARNRGIRLSKHKYIAFLDADDFWTPDKLATQREALLAHPSAGLAYSWAVILDEEGYIQHQQTPIIFNGDVHQELLKQNFLYCGSTPLLRRDVVEAVGFFDTGLTPVEDWDYWIRVAAQYPFTVVPKHQTYYCKSSVSSSSAVSRLEEKLFLVIEKSYSDVPASMQSGKNQSLANAHYYLTSQYLDYQTDRDGIKRAGKNFYRALKLKPSFALNLDTYFLGTKWLLKASLPAAWTDRIIRYYREFRTRQSSSIIPTLSP